MADLATPCIPGKNAPRYDGYSLRSIGGVNGVVPQQAAAALRLMLARAQEAAA